MPALVFDRIALHMATVLLAAVLATPAHAEIQYITDQVSATLRANPVSDGKQVGNPLVSGNPVEVLQRSPDGKWARVRFQQVEGWLPAPLLQKEQSAHDRLLELQARYDALTREQKTGGSRLGELEAEVQSLRASLQQAQAERDTALAQLGDLKLSAAGPQKLAASNNALNVRATTLAIDNERLKTEVERLEQSEEASFLFYGGLIVFGGMGLGWLMARQSGGRRSGW